VCVVGDVFQPYHLQFTSTHYLYINIYTHNHVVVVSRCTQLPERSAGGIQAHAAGGCTLGVIVSSKCAHDVPTAGTQDTGTTTTSATAQSDDDGGDDGGAVQALEHAGAEAEEPPGPEAARGEDGDRPVPGQGGRSGGAVHAHLGAQAAPERLVGAAGRGGRAGAGLPVPRDADQEQAQRRDRVPARVHEIQVRHFVFVVCWTPFFALLLCARPGRPTDASISQYFLH
jgi:hypothetical protein